MMRPQADGRLTERLYRTLLYLYPAEFRAEYGPQLVQHFRDCLREAVRTGGAAALARVWARTCVDFARSLRSEWASTLMPNPRSRRPRRRTHAHVNFKERSVRLMNGILRDLRYALRTLRREPAFTVVAVLTLGLGTAANTAIFSVVNSVLLRPLRYGYPEDIRTTTPAEARA